MLREEIAALRGWGSGWAVRLIFMSPYIRTVRTTSGATAVQVVYSEKRGSKPGSTDVILG
ncbi:hypothetical protein GCM10010980_24660 [Corynebacterium marinum]|nr:hypothetical protein GCM10010980_24660 [Corynebacterium marinum]